MQERCSSERQAELWAIKGFSWHSRVSHISLKWYENCKSPAVITFLSGGRGRCRHREEAREELWEDLNGRRENETGSVRIEWTCITKETEPVLIVEWISIQITWLVNISQKKSVHMFHNYRTESWIIESQLNTWHTIFFKSWIERSCLKIKINISTTSVTQSYWGNFGMCFQLFLNSPRIMQHSHKVQTRWIWASVFDKDAAVPFPGTADAL